MKWTKIIFICQFTHVGGLINQKTALSSTNHWAEALKRFCITVGGVAAAVSVFVQLNQFSQILSRQCCLPLPRSNRAEANRVKNSEVTTLDKICRVSSNCAGSKLCRRDMKYEKVGVLKMNVLALNSYTYFKLSLAGNVVFPISNFWTTDARRT